LCIFEVPVSQSLWTRHHWKDLFLLQKLSIDDANFGQRWWRLKWKKGQGSSRAVTGGPGVNGLKTKALLSFCLTTLVLMNKQCDQKTYSYLILYGCWCESNQVYSNYKPLSASDILCSAHSPSYLNDCKKKVCCKHAFSKSRVLVNVLNGSTSPTVLCKSNANEIRRNLSFVLSTFLRKVIEFSKDVSKGSKRKNHDLPRKFERAKFEVATFQGNQTKKYDTKFEAANCYMTRTAANDVADQALVNKLNSYRK